MEMKEQRTGHIYFYTSFILDFASDDLEHAVQSNKNLIKCDLAWIKQAQRRQLFNSDPWLSIGIHSSFLSQCLSLGITTFHNPETCQLDKLANLYRPFVHA